MVKEFVTERLRLIDLYPDKAREVAKEYGLKEDEVELIRKGRVSSQPVIDRDARTVINYISTDAIDRDNEVIEHRGVVLDDYVKNPIVPWAHDYRGLPIGKNLWIKPDKKGLVAKTYFLKHDFAEDVFDLYTEDIKGTGPALKAWSVGFIPLKWKDAKPDEKVAENERPQTVRRTYKKWLLLEYSAVPVPSNPEALTLMVEKGLIKNEKLKKDIEDFIIEIKEEDKEEEKEYEFLHDDVKDDLQVDHKSADKFHKHLMSLVTKPEENDKEIRIPAKGQEGKHKDHPIRWITVSEEKGIKGLYCIKDKLIITYVFDKSKGWTMEKAKKWMKDNGKDVRIEETVNALTGELGLYIIYDGKDSTVDLGIIEPEEKGVIPFKETSKAPDDEKWDASREVRQAEVSDLKVMCTWFDSENPDTKGSYKLPHHKASGHAVVWRAVAAAMAALLGARGGVQIPDKDRKGVYNHLVKSYKQFDKEPPEFREYTEEEETTSEELTTCQSCGFVFNYSNEPEVSMGAVKCPKCGIVLNQEGQILATETEDPIKWIKELTEEVKALKEGRVLSGKNLKLVKDCAEQIAKVGELLNKLIVASEPPKEESILPLIEESKSKEDNNIDSLTKEDMPIVVEEILKGLKEGMSSQRKEIQELFDKKRGKVN